jgi:pyridoxal phosphate enzyme (YggS family)
MDIAAKITTIQQKLAPYACTLVAVTKTHPVEVIAQALAAGVQDLGENRVQEMEDKKAALPGARWHMIGHLQRNKARFIAPYVYLIHGVESFELLAEIDRQAAKANRSIPVLLQMHIAQEETKFGLDRAELEALLQNPKTAQLAHVHIRGLMGMATNTQDKALIRGEFKGLRQIFEECRASIRLPNMELKELSMGMSGDWQVALEEGSTMVRIGSAIFARS